MAFVVVGEVWFQEKPEPISDITSTSPTSCDIRKIIGCGRTCSVIKHRVCYQCVSWCPTVHLSSAPSFFTSFSSPRFSLAGSFVSITLALALALNTWARHLHYFPPSTHGRRSSLLIAYSSFSWVLSWMRETGNAILLNTI